MSCARRPSFPFIGRASKPSEAVGTRKALIPFGPCAAGPGEDDRRRGPGAERDEDLRAGQHPVVAVALCARRERCRVRPAAGLGQRVAAERLAAREPRQVLLPLLVGPPLRDRLPVQAVRDGDDPAHGRVGFAELLAEQAVGDGVEPAAAELLGERGREEAGIGERADERARQLLGLVPLTRVGRSSRSQSSRAESRISSCSGVRVKSMENDVGAVAGPHDHSIFPVRH